MNILKQHYWNKNFYANTYMNNLREYYVNISMYIYTYTYISLFVIAY